MNWRARSMTARLPGISRGWGRTAWISSTFGTSGLGGTTSGTRRAWSACGTTVVDPEFIESLDSAGYKNLSAVELVRLRDHGVDGGYIADMKEAGYAPSNAEELVESRDHGVDPSYIASLKEAGYERLSLQELR